MKILSGMLGAVAAIALLAGPALAQGGPARYGEPDKDKSPTEKAAEKDAERAYQRSLSNIPEQKAPTPGGSRARARRPTQPRLAGEAEDQIRRYQAGQYRKIEGTGPGAKPGQRCPGRGNRK